MTQPRLARHMSGPADTSKSRAASIVGVFGAVPLLLFGATAVAGATWLVGDNLLQNFPLRVLVGIDIRHGHLPVWNPYLWSGTPLLAGFNAGGAYPLTWLFALLPGALSWVLNQAAAQFVVSMGMLALLRTLGRSWLSSSLAAAAYSYGGFVAAQNLHIDLVQATGWLVWAFVSLVRVAKATRRARQALWSAALGMSLGLMVLSGTAEPIADGAVALAILLCWLLWEGQGRRVRIALWSAWGVGIGFLVGAAQWLPGIALRQISQRGLHTYTYFSSGSLNKSLTILGLDPALLGGAHGFPLSYVGTYNLPEVSSYVGILPVMAIFGLLSRHHRQSPGARQHWVWYVIMVVGLVLAWGAFTPLAHVMYHVPLYNDQRLLNRNLMEVDLAACVLFAYWLDSTFTRDGLRPEIAGPQTAGQGGAFRRCTSDVVLPLLPVVAVVGLHVVMLAGGTWFPHFLHVPGPLTRSGMWWLIAMLSVPSAVALWAGYLVVNRGRLLERRPPRVVASLVALVAIDLLVFNVAMQGTPDPNGATSQGATGANLLLADLRALGSGPGGELHRLAFFDPDRYYPVEANRLGQPDMTLLRGEYTMDGYGGLVDARYDEATGTQLQLYLNPPSLADGTSADLDLGLVVTVPAYFLHMVAAPPGFTGSLQAGAVPLPPNPPSTNSGAKSGAYSGAKSGAESSGEPASPEFPPVQPTPPADFDYLPAPSAGLVVSPGQARTEFFGTVLAVRAVSIPIAQGEVSAASLQIGLLSADGTSTAWLSADGTSTDSLSYAAPIGGRGTTTLRASAPAPIESCGLVLRSAPHASNVTTGYALVATAGQGTYRVDGSLRDVITAPRWHFDAELAPFALFAQDSARGRTWVEGALNASARVMRDTPWGDTTIEVSSPSPATLVRSVQYDSQWKATVARTGSTSDPVQAPVRRHGLVQQVAVPAGTSLVRFTYGAARERRGIVFSLVGLVVALATAASPVAYAKRRRRLRHRRVRARISTQPGRRTSS